MKSKKEFQQNIKEFRKRLTKNPIRIVIGGFFVLLGVIGGLLPILQGWLFFLIGLAILLEESIIERLKETWRSRRIKKSLRKIRRSKSISFKNKNNN